MDVFEIIGAHLAGRDCIAFVLEPVFGNGVDDLLKLFCGERCQYFDFGGLEFGGFWQQDVVFDERKCALEVWPPCFPIVMKVEAGAIVYDPNFIVPMQQVGVLDCAVYVADDAVQQRDFGCRECVNFCNERIVGDGAGQKVQPEIETDAELQKILNFFVGFGFAKGFVEVHKDEFGYVESDGARHFATDEFGYECFFALTCAAKLEDIEKTVVGLDDGGERSAFAKWFDVLVDVCGSYLQVVSFEF